MKKRGLGLSGGHAEPLPYSGGGSARPLEPYRGGGRADEIGYDEDGFYPDWIDEIENADEPYGSGVSSFGGRVRDGTSDGEPRGTFRDALIDAYRRGRDNSPPITGERSGGDWYTRGGDNPYDFNDPDPRKRALARAWGEGRQSRAQRQKHGGGSSWW